jgi:hypothetical protein
MGPSARSPIATRTTWTIERDFSGEGLRSHSETHFVDCCISGVAAQAGAVFKPDRSLSVLPSGLG